MRSGELNFDCMKTDTNEENASNVVDLRVPIFKSHVYLNALSPLKSVRAYFLGHQKQGRAICRRLWK